MAAIGNAAQTLHPVAGQGLNLGLRDAARLAQALGAWLPGPDASPAPALAEFAGARQFDRLITAGLTDLMPRVFATGLAPVEHACGLALLGLDLAAPLRAAGPASAAGIPGLARRRPPRSGPGKGPRLPSSAQVCYRRCRTKKI